MSYLYVHNAFKRRLLKIMRRSAPTDSLLNRLFDYFISTLIVINVLIVILETSPNFTSTYGTLFAWADTIIALVFTAEYLARLWSCTAIKKYQHPIFGRLKFFFSPLLVIDALGIIPFYIPLFFAIDLKLLRILRLFRLIRILKIYRYSDGLQMFIRVLILKRRQFGAAFLVLAIGLLFASTLLYLVEHDVQPEHFGSIPAALWWASITLSTVGYGDVIPITPLGRLFGACIALMGVGVFAIPAGILATGYMRLSGQKLRPLDYPKKSRRRQP